jgi:hypothetical protein
MFFPEESDVQSRRAPALKNTCHDARFAPHVGFNVNAGYISPAARFLPHRSRPAAYPPNRQPATVGVEEWSGRGTTSSRTTTGAAPELSPPKSACSGDAVLRTSTRGTVPMGQCASAAWSTPETSMSCPTAAMRIFTKSPSDTLCLAIRRKRLRRVPLWPCASDQSRRLTLRASPFPPCRP